MIGLLGQQLLAIAGLVLLLGVPGWAIGRHLQVQLAVPAVLLPPTWFALGLGAFTVSLLLCLGLGWSASTLLLVHGGLSVLVLAGLLWRSRRAGAAHAKSSGVDPVSWWTIGGIAACTLLALGLRTRLAFDTLFHVGMVRRLAELPHPTFDSLDRVAGVGVNPAYVVPSWQAALGSVSALTGLDPATVVEAMAAPVVFLAACAAAGFGRVLGGRAAAEVAGLGAYALMRVWYPRREAEGDGVGYAVHPGNVALDVLLPVVLAATLVVALRARGAVGRRSAVVVAGAASVMFVLLHANYVVYLGIIGAGLVGWLLVAGPWASDVRRRVLDAGASVAVPGAVTLALLLPALMTLDHFGEAVEQRIDYHLVGSGAWEIVRPGHFYDAYGVAGLLAMLLAPFAVWALAGVRRAMLGGGLVLLLATGLVPWLHDLLAQSGSLTVGLRLPRPVGVLLIGAVAVALPLLVDRLRGMLDRRSSRLGRLLLVAGPVVVAAALAFAYGYPSVRQEPAEYGWNWPTLVALAGLLVVLVLAVRTRRSVASVATDAPELTPELALPGRRSAVAATGIAVLLLAVALIPSGVVSLRRATWQSRQLVSAVRADELGCLAGVQRKLRGIAPGTLLLADPMTGYVAQALGPVVLFGDFKTWNGSTESGRAQARVEVLEQVFDGDDAHEVADIVADLRRLDDARYVLVAAGEVEPPIGSELPTFDAVGLRAALLDGQLPAHRIAHGEAHDEHQLSDEERTACTLELWALDAPAPAPGRIDVEPIARDEATS
ncbi:MAG: hypothetical protein JWO69_1077 [Thermoleophilia bacterium]|nr:hypothetical protein [Thermoleophilia bacterium]